MNSETPVQRSFAAAGVATHRDLDHSEIGSATIAARIVRDGKVFPVPTARQAPSTVRLVVNIVALFSVVLFIGLSFLAFGPIAIGYHPVVVGSGSMSPSLHVADVVLVRSPQHKSIGVGTIIDIATADGGKIHRVVEVLPEGYRTKGDANATADSEIVAAPSVTGVGAFLVPFVGLPRVWFDNGQWLKLGVLLGFFVAAAHCSRSKWLNSQSHAVAVRRRSPRLGNAR